MDELFEMIEELPPWLTVGWTFLIGSFVGSFLNVVIYRLPRNCLSINKPRRSFCPSCKNQLKWNDNLPIIGWALLRGKCRYCSARFGIRYPLIELLTAALFAFAAWRVLYADGNVSGEWQSWLTLLHVLGIIGVLLPWAIIDYDLTYIPNRLTFGPLIVFIPFSAHWPALSYGLDGGIDHFLFNFEPWWLNSMLSALIAGFAAMAGLWMLGKFFNVIFAARVKEIGGESMGGADIRLMLLLGVMLGWPKLLAGFFLAIFVGAVFGGAQLLMRKGHGTPFGPYLALGAICAALFMPWVIGLYNWYMQFLEGVAT